MTTLERFENIVSQLERARLERKRRTISQTRRAQLTKRIDHLLDEYLDIAKERSQAAN